MNWHDRYIQQAGWTRALRAYLFDKTGLIDADRVLEVGCGTGAILCELSTQASLHGLDISIEALRAAHLHAPQASLVQGDALKLPYTRDTFNITYCHFLLLWVKTPLQALLEMKRVTRPKGYVLAMAEPDYTARLDRPDELAMLGKWQTESLQRQGADVSLGGQLADLFYQVGIRIVETGTIQSRSRVASRTEQEKEWAVLESDLTGFIPDSEIQRMKQVDQKAWASGQREMFVPTYFVWGQV